MTMKTPRRSQGTAEGTGAAELSVLPSAAVWRTRHRVTRTYREEAREDGHLH